MGFSYVLGCVKGATSICTETGADWLRNWRSCFVMDFGGGFD